MVAGRPPTAHRGLRAVPAGAASAHRGSA